MNPTPRQLEVLRELWQDKTRKQVGMEIGISLPGVDYHLTRLARMAKTKSVIGLLRWGIANGYLTAELPRCKSCGQTLKSL